MQDTIGLLLKERSFRLMMLKPVFDKKEEFEVYRFDGVKLHLSKELIKQAKLSLKKNKESFFNDNGEKCIIKKKG